ncbi:ROK family protein [Streptomyces sp. NPDC020917]|uniref:ROK family protein n=1 Tax=Streptomyces sp. NPDC020917 TaxID=3365102 RepID=UPI0037B5276A
MTGTGAFLGGDTAALRRLNSAALLKHLHSAEAVTLTELSRISRLSRPTCEEVMTELLSQGWAAEVFPDPEARRTVGRPARRFRFHSEAGHVLGVDIGAHKVLATVADLSGKVVGTSRQAVDPEMAATQRLHAAGEAIAVALADAGKAARARQRSTGQAGEVTPSGRGAVPLLSTVIGTTGIVSPDGTVVRSVALPGWDGMDLRAAAARLLPRPARTHVRVENDITLAGIAEHWCGTASNVDDVVYVHAGRRMGAGILIGGRPHRGRHGMAGEIGMLDLLGWAEAYQSFPHHPGGDPVEHAFTAARAGDREAAALVESFAAALAKGVATMTLSVDPELVVVGGGLSRTGDQLLEPVRRHVRLLCPLAPDIVASRLGDENVALGAVRLALDAVESDLFSTP